jgi:serine/threonine-protein kinase RsbW
MAAGINGDDESDVVNLQLPADSAYASIARTATMALGLRAGFAWPTLTALALAVDETMVMLLGPSGPAPHPDDTLELTFAVAPGGLELTVTADGSGPAIDPGGTSVQRFTALMADLVDSWTLDPAAGSVTMTVTR